MARQTILLLRPHRHVQIRALFFHTFSRPQSTYPPNSTLKIDLVNWNESPVYMKIIKLYPPGTIIRQRRQRLLLLLWRDTHTRPVNRGNEIKRVRISIKSNDSHNVIALDDNWRPTDLLRVLWVTHAQLIVWGIFPVILDINRINCTFHNCLCFYKDIPGI